MSLEGLASIAIAHRHMSAAARLLGAATSIRAELSSTLSSAEQLDFDARVTTVRKTLGRTGVRARMGDGGRVDSWELGPTISTALALPQATGPREQGVLSDSHSNVRP